MATDADARDLMDLLRRRFSVEGDDRHRPMNYRHVIAPPVSGGAVDVPSVVAQFLTATDGAQLFSSDDEELKAIGAPLYAAVLYDRSEIIYASDDLREQLLTELPDCLAEGSLSEDRMSVLSHQASQFWVVGATVDGDSFVVESKTATSIRIWPHETPLAPFFDPDEAPRVDGLAGLLAFLEERLR